jgi:hypothetical protein
MPRLIEDCVRELLVEKYSLEECVHDAKDFEVDGILLKFKRPEIALEVKWEKVRGEELKRITEKLAVIPARRKVLFLPDKKGYLPTWVRYQALSLFSLS